MKTFKIELKREHTRGSYMNTGDCTLVRAVREFFGASFVTAGSKSISLYDKDLDHSRAFTVTRVDTVKDGVAEERVGDDARWSHDDHVKLREGVYQSAQIEITEHEYSPEED